jgi:hypothetical protein
VTSSSGRGATEKKSLLSNVKRKRGRESERERERERKKEKRRDNERNIKERNIT